MTPCPTDLWDDLNEPSFPMPPQPLRTKRQMAQWLTWQRYIDRGSRPPAQYYAMLMTWTKSDVAKRVQVVLERMAEKGIAP